MGPSVNPELAQAIFNVQTTAAVALKDNTNPHFKNKYADLNAVWDAVREPLKANGLAVVQSAEPLMEEGKVCGIHMVTTLLHVSGHTLSTLCALPATRQDPQQYGSAITYARRYGLCNALGVLADVDDDGNQAASPSKRADHPAVKAVKESFSIPDSAEQWEAKIATIKTKKSAEIIKDGLFAWYKDNGVSEEEARKTPLFEKLAARYKVVD